MATQIIRFTGPEGINGFQLYDPEGIEVGTHIVPVLYGDTESVYDATYTDLVDGTYYFEAFIDTAIRVAGYRTIGGAGTYTSDGDDETPPPTPSIYNLTISQELPLTEIPVTNTQKPFYGSIEEGDEYFLQVLRSDDWFTATKLQKQQALFSATELIDKFAYRGQKTDEDQQLEFPRGGDTKVPKDILIATFMIAIKLLSSFDEDQEIKETLVTSSKFGPTEQQYNPNRRTPMHLLAGIPSLKAWHKLLPYFREPEDVNLVRVN